MARKLIKYGKFLMSVALIFCMMAPSYAALSNTDGAAFVTKAEFDSALADFNSRLTTFEAGVNSKIDSQVTSYLDRNGIWKGDDQTFVLTHTYNAGIYGTAGGYYTYYNHPASGDTTATKVTIGGPHATYYIMNTKLNNGRSEKIIDNVTKSGLMCLYYEREFGNKNSNGVNDEGATGTGGQGCCVKTAYGTIIPTYDAYLDFSVTLGIYEDDATDESKLLYSELYTKRFPMPFNIYATSFPFYNFFFVRRNHELWYKTTVGVNVNNCGNLGNKGMYVYWKNFKAKVY